ncbi:MAG: hydrogenase expression/formation protein HypE [Desulfobacterales bacterium]|nr:hydrogenase expression/formation protein HypE [Desulfobacterales bacterium]
MKDKNVLLDHGSGGKRSNMMISDIILPAFDNPMLAALNDSAVFEIDGKKLSFSTDSYVIDPIFFPGGNIGELAVNGTINDVSMCGAKPLYLSVGIIMEEGFPFEDLEIIIKSMGEAAKKAGIQIVTGDTKVVSKGACDKIFINTSGIGVVDNNLNINGQNARVGDKIIVSGTIADHGMAVLAKREGMDFDTDIVTDSAPLNHMISDMLEISSNVHVLRDPTRGGVGTTLNEIAGQSDKGILIYENKLPVKDSVKAICELLGFDPLYVANEGKLLCFVAEEDCDKVLESIRKSEFGKDACVIGEVVEENPGRVFLETLIGGRRIIDMLTGEQLPRIC